MSTIAPGPLPINSLLRGYVDDGAYTDCYSTDVAGQVSHAQFIEAFYTTPLFKTERLILRWLVSKASSDDDVRKLAAGQTENFAVWYVEKRGENQILLSDFRGRTRSWLMVGPSDGDAAATTRLYFGSAVVPVRKDGAEKPRLGLTYRALLGFHKLYSVALLRAARSRLVAQRGSG